MPSVVKQSWIESERGWGTRPDGYSLHLSVKDKDLFIREYWLAQPGGPAPAEYSAPDGHPTLIDVNDELYNEIKASKNGVRKYR